MAAASTQTAIALRPVCPDDRAFLLRVYASTREEELATVGWSPEQKASFVEMQFAARARDYEARFGHDGHAVIEDRGEPVGYLWVHRSNAEIRIVDVALLPEHRGRGIGTEIIADLVAEARRQSLPLRLYVLTHGAARRLYERLGFAAIGEASVHQQLELVP